MIEILMDLGLMMLGGALGTGLVWGLFVLHEQIHYGKH